MPAQHTDLNAILMEALSRISDSSGKYDSEDQSVWFIVAQLIMKMEDLGNQVSAIGIETSAFNVVQGDIHNVQRDITAIEKWQQDHKGLTPFEAANDPDFIKLTQNFQKDMTTYGQDATKYNMNKNYRNDGMQEAFDAYAGIMGDTSLTPDGSSIADLIQSGDTTTLAGVLFDAASKTTESSGPLNNWTNVGVGGKTSLNNAEQDFGTFIGNFNQTLNLDGTNLNQVDGAGQKIVDTLNQLVMLMVQNQASR